MIESKKTVQESVFIFAKKYNQEKNYQLLLQSTNLLRTVDCLIKDLFLNRFDFHHCSSDEFKAYNVIYSYYKEIQETGEVKFGNS